MIGLHNIDKQFGTAFPYRFPGIVKYLLFSLCVSCCLSCKVRRTRSFVIFWSHGVVRSFIHKNFLTPPPKITNVIFKLKFWFWRILREREKEKNGSHCLASFAFVHYVVDDKKDFISFVWSTIVDNDDTMVSSEWQQQNKCRRWWMIIYHITAKALHVHRITKNTKQGRSFFFGLHYHIISPSRAPMIKR